MTDRRGRRRRLVAAVMVAVGLLAAACGGSAEGGSSADIGADRPSGAEALCTPVATRSVARAWNEALLGAIRLDVPAPTVHARNLFHTSAAMWDAWAAYDDVANGVFFTDRQQADDIAAARDEAISYAAYRVLESRYLFSPGAEESITGFEQLMRDLCFDPSYSESAGDDPAAVGNRIAATILAASADDGSNEAGGYLDPTYRPVNEPLVVAESGTTMLDPNRWQPLEIEGMVAQNGTPLLETVQTFVGSHWGSIAPFALAPPADGTPLLDPGPPPMLGHPATDADYKAGAIEVLRHAATLDPNRDNAIDIGPASMGNSQPGTYVAQGWAENPVTGERYGADEVLLGDFARVVAEFWADGPSSETPPGHWNVVANEVSDSLGELRIGGSGPVVDPLEWDVKLYLALNGAMHDGAIAAWGAKRTYDYARPISMIRYMGGLGQSSEPDGLAFHRDGLPLEPDLVEVITTESSAPGERHAHLAGHLGEIAVRSWLGTPADPAAGVSGVGWLLAVDWVPYQLSTFVTPAFAGYVSGHSTFSRAGAEILTAMTGSPFFPGGLGQWTVPAGTLEFDAGPATDVVLQWASFVDASDQAGESRLYGGIHPPADDFPGREIGVRSAAAAWALAQRHFSGAT